MRLFLGVLLLMWGGVAIYVLGPGFRDWNRFKSLSLLSRINGKSSSESDSLHHVHAEPHSEIRTRSHEVLAPAPSVRIARHYEAAPSTTFIDPWTNERIDYNGEVVTQTTAHSPASLNARAEAYRRARPEGLEVHRRPIAPSPNRPVSASRKAALRRRMILKYLGIALAFTTAPAVLTSWTIFVVPSVMVWLVSLAWFAMSIRQFVRSELRGSVEGPLSSRDSTLPDNVISIRRARREESAETLEAVDDEFFDPRTVGGFRHANFAVGE